MLSNFQLEIVLGMVAQNINNDSTFPRKHVEMKVEVYDKRRHVGLRDIRQDMHSVYPYGENMQELQEVAEKILLLLNGDKNDSRMPEFQMYGEILNLIREKLEVGSKT